MSANTGVAPQCHTALAVAMNDSEGTITSSPGPTPLTWRASASAVVQFVVATASADPTRAANCVLELEHLRTLGDPAGGDHLGHRVLLGAGEVGAA